ncbi:MULTISPECIES: hypothetical protein [Chromohalobacter]|uniref:Uncharacterized protein n=1 Tax=Chromohalobacter canadensis TaxID=141389 RepID=A0A285VQX9_9GAMM|nr:MULTISPECIES: hypothetical protein [Chromohalobacter]MCK0744107.1 hypothetical protein [Chromohalobacter nigrandesensis]SOC56469.1 hypothetical protein SAMN05421509_10765 [Chromohalobacter canadensis]
MALSKSQLKSRIVSEMRAQGATATGEYSWVNRMAEAIANAVVDEVQSNAEVPVTGGSSSGTYEVK